ncbi:MAG: diguanylate cyclase [Candidatus Scalindua sp.]|jgi:diguanylate cyclase (GGDEF)-like protein|nr:diguanylate cyclase [Candidatus Scalindua sp.]MBT5307627.1 diguanylate cyclase [Candidatus Scalindua sp.]MBT6046371.1 diguanylate cyclase [Candidatus Scalindua sp.]MBT6230932.1 diguanylate cyclase [Candidatus Scalindua sp.]MBT6563669.1 diguanylate cyclase [Candidatus Scalindua sp.]
MNEIELLKRRLQREKNIRQQAEKIAEEKSRELYLKGEELKNALQAESEAKKKIEALYQEVERLSRIDPLTELSNRRSFSTDALRLLQLAIRHKKKLSCAMLDIDFFKKVNDTYGHDFGDKVLIAVAKASRNQLRKTDLLARFGGEEFCFLFAETDLNGAALIAERIRLAISKLEFHFEKIRFSVTVSIGVSGLLDSNDNMENMIKRSDTSLYKAKENGRNRIVIWEN